MTMVCSYALLTRGDPREERYLGGTTYTLDKRTARRLKKSTLPTGEVTDWRKGAMASGSQ
jgi:hypothetical protein